MYRTRKHNKIYQSHIKKHRANSTCTLCDLTNNVIIHENKFLTIVKNKFPYSYWEGRKVLEQYMIVPKVHSKDLKGLPINIINNIFKIIIEYETNGFEIYIRGTNSSARSVKGHLHIHLIKTEDKIANINISIEKPYFVFVK